MVFNKDWQKDIIEEMVEIILYGKPRPKTTNKKALVSFLRIVNLIYMCRLIHSFLFNIVMPRLGSRDYVSDKDICCMYKVIVNGKVKPSTQSEPSQPRLKLPTKRKDAPAHHLTLNP